MNAGQQHSFDTPALTAELLSQILAGRTLREPALEAAMERAEETGSFECPFCRGVNDGVIRIKSDGMGAESVALTLEWLFNPSSRDFCLCQLYFLTMQTGDENENDTIPLMTKYILPLYYYYGLRFVELARAGEHDQDGIVVLQDTRSPRRLYHKGYYKLSDHLLKNGTVPQAAGKRVCSMRFKGWVADQWLEHCFGLGDCYHAFGFNAAEGDRITDSVEAIEKHNARLSPKKGKKKKSVKKARRIRYRVAGDSLENYELVDATFVGREEAERLGAAAGAPLIVRMCFGFNSSEGERIVETERYDSLRRTTYGGKAPDLDKIIQVRSKRPLKRVAFFPLQAWGWTRERCLQSISERLGVLWPKSCCNQCVFDKESSKATPAGVARKKNHPEQTARSLLIEYGSLCLNERGALYVKRTLQAIALSTEQLRALTIFEETLSKLDFSLVEVKRIYADKDSKARSVIKLATGSRAQMTALFEDYAAKLSLEVTTLHGINYAVFARPAYTPERTVPGRGKRTRRVKPQMIYPSVEGFLVVAPAHISEKVRGSFVAFEERFANVAQNARGIILPALPGTAIVRRREAQATLFDEAAAA